MSSKRIIVCLMICAVFAAGITVAQSTTKKPAPEPTAFSEEGDQFKSSVPIPDNVLDALHNNLDTDSMKYLLEHLDRDKFAQLFKAVVIHLRDTKEIDYVLLSEYPLSGADAPWFWIVRFDQAHPKIIFFALANDFDILNARTNGYPNIRSHGYTAGGIYTSIYHYNGQRYVSVHDYHKENNPEP